MRRIIIGLKALVGFPFYVYKSYQLLKKMVKSQRPVSQETEKVQKIEEMLIDISSLQSASKNQVKEMYELFFHREINPVRLQKESPVIFDCGAHIGMFSLYCKYLYPNSKIYAYEPDPKNFTYLKHNLQNYNNIIISNEAIGSKNEVLSFYSEGSDASSLFDNNLNLNREEIKVNVVSLKNLIEKNKEIDMIKIDIEGAEVEALSVCDGVLGNVGQIIIEYHDLKTNPNRLSSILATLEKNNFFYFLYYLDNQHKNIFESSKNLWNMNFIVCIHALNKNMKN